MNVAGCFTRHGSLRRRLAFALIPIALFGCGTWPAGERRVSTVAANATLPESWGLPAEDPCAVLSSGEVGALAQLSPRIARAGGTAIDGSACAYLFDEPFVVTIGLISTAAFESVKVGFRGEHLLGVGHEAYVRGPDELADVVVLARSLDHAVKIGVTGVHPALPDGRRRVLATRLATEALSRLQPDDTQRDRSTAPAN